MLGDTLLIELQNMVNEIINSQPSPDLSSRDRVYKMVYRDLG